MEKKRFDLLSFDLDGTLVRSGEDIALAVNHSLVTLGLDALDRDRIIEYIGDGFQTLLVRALGKQADRYLEKALGLFTDYYASHLLDHTTLYPGARELLEHFRHKKKLVITNKREHFAVAILNGLGIASHFLAIIGEDTTAYRKPDRRLLDQVMAQWSVPPEKTLMIGDGINDILVAKRAGAVSCAFLDGLTDRETLLSLSPDLYCEHLSELAALIE